MCIAISTIKANAQNSFCAKLIFEYFKNDTGFETVLDTVFVGTDSLGGPGYQFGLDNFVDSLKVPGTNIYDSAFNVQFPNKYLKKSIEKFRIGLPSTKFRIRTIGQLNSIYWDSSDFSKFRIGKYQIVLELYGPEGSSIGAWDVNSLFLILNNNTYRKKIQIYQLQYNSEISIYFTCIDTTLMGVNNTQNASSFSVYFSAINELVISTTNSDITEDTKIFMFKLNGEKIEFEGTPYENSQTRISLKNWTPGIYLYKIETPIGINVGKIFIPSN